MRQFAEQVRQVGIVYVTQIRGWVWALAGIVCAFMLLGLFGADGRSARILPVAFAFAQFFSAWIADQAKHQFAHPRASLLPHFCSAHLFVPIAFILFGSSVPPTILYAFGKTDPFPFIAVTSIWTALLLLGRLLPSLGWLVAPIIVLAFVYSGDSARKFDLTNLLFLPAFSIPFFFLGWLGIAFYFFKLCHLAEDDTAYNRLSGETLTVTAAGDESETRAKYRNAARWWAISDRWHARIGGFHQGRTLRIIRLLRYGFGATPVEFTAIGWAIFMTIIVGWMLHDADDPYDTTRSTSAIFLIVPTLFACMAPIAVAGGAIGWRVPRLRNEILFPLTRRELIDGLLLTAAWHSLVIWLLGCACGTGILLYALPVEAKTVSLFATAALLTAAVAVAAYGLSLHIVMFEVKAAQFFVLGLFVLGVIFLMCAWWESREDISDAPYWVMAAMVMGVGAMMTHTGRTVWLNQEFG